MVRENGVAREAKEKKSNASMHASSAISGHGSLCSRHFFLASLQRLFTPIYGIELSFYCWYSTILNIGSYKWRWKALLYCPRLTHMATSSSSLRRRYAMLPDTACVTAHHCNVQYSIHVGVSVEFRLWLLHVHYCPTPRC